MPTARITRAIIAKKKAAAEIRERGGGGGEGEFAIHRSRKPRDEDIIVIRGRVFKRGKNAKEDGGGRGREGGTGEHRGSEKEGERERGDGMHLSTGSLTRNMTRAQAELGAPFLEKYFSAVRGTMAFSRNIQGKTGAYMNKLRIGLYACNWQLSGATFLEFSFYDH